MALTIAGSQTSLKFPGGLALVTPFAVTKPATGVGSTSATLEGTVVGKAKLRKGKARMRLKKLGVGVWKVTVAYLGDSVTETSSRTVRVRVVR